MPLLGGGLTVMRRKTPPWVMTCSMHLRQHKLNLYTYEVPALYDAIAIKLHAGGRKGSQGMAL